MLYRATRNICALLVKVFTFSKIIVDYGSVLFHFMAYTQKKNRKFSTIKLLSPMDVLSLWQQNEATNYMQHRINTNEWTKYEIKCESFIHSFIHSVIVWQNTLLQLHCCCCYYYCCNCCYYNTRNFNMSACINFPRYFFSILLAGKEIKRGWFCWACSKQKPNNRMANDRE